MDYESYDNDTDPSDEDYFAFVEWLSNRTASELRQALGDREVQQQALCRYYKRGERANLTTGEMIDFLGVSTPSIRDRAGYNEEQGDLLMQISDALTEDDIQRSILPNVS